MKGPKYSSTIHPILPITEHSQFTNSIKSELLILIFTNFAINQLSNPLTFHIELEPPSYISV